MTHKFTISLKNRLTLTYVLFISLAMLVLCIVINLFTNIIFAALVKNNIAAKSREIIRIVEEQYNPLTGGFNTETIETMGMYFVSEGFIVTVEDRQGNRVWNARSCDFHHCTSVINEITARMESRFLATGSMRLDTYPVIFKNSNVGTVFVETYGPFFYSKTEARFLSAINSLLLIAGIALTVICVIISTALSRTIAKPIIAAGEAAKKIAGNYLIRIPDHYKTRELAELSRSINALAGELEEAERRKKQLTSDIAHELRTPLTCLQGNIEAMIDGVYAPDRERLESCHEEIKRLANLVQDLDILTNLEWEIITLNKTEFDLAKLLQVTAEQWRMTAAGKGIAIQLNAKETIITADYDRLKQVFINILSNAVKYTDKGGITVTIETADEKPGRQCLVSIADTGIGIPDGDLPHIFERFYRSDKSRSRSTGGAGIGLTIAAAIVHAHGGNIEVKSGKSGTVFTVAL